MFEDVLRTIKELNGSTFSMKIEEDAEGYIDKECPNPECMSKFKVKGDDWEKLFSDDTVYCPFCGHVDKSENWFTTEQVELAQHKGREYIEAKIGRAFKNDADRFNRTQPRNGFIKLSMSYSGKTTFVSVPAPALNEMIQKITCEYCHARYAVVGSAFYCPCCGKNSAKLTFSNTINKVKTKVDNIPRISEAIEDADDRSRIVASLLESSIADLVIAFQRVCECIYPLQKGAKTNLRRNVFQNLDEGNRLWKDVLQKGYDDWLDSIEYRQLKICFQKRHLLQHRDGIIDQDYINKSGDYTYQVGQRLVVHDYDIHQYADVVKKVADIILALA